MEKSTCNSSRLETVRSSDCGRNGPNDTVRQDRRHPMVLKGSTARLHTANNGERTPLSSGLRACGRHWRFRVRCRRDDIHSVGEGVCGGVLRDHRARISQMTAGTQVTAMNSGARPPAVAAKKGMAVARTTIAPATSHRHPTTSPARSPRCRSCSPTTRSGGKWRRFENHAKCSMKNIPHTITVAAAQRRATQPSALILSSDLCSPVVTRGDRHTRLHKREVIGDSPRESGQVCRAYAWWLPDSVEGRRDTPAALMSSTAAC